MSTAQVQTWVGTILVIAFVGHLTEALVLFAVAVPTDRPSSAIGLLVLAGVTGVLTVLGVRAVRRLRLVTLWVLLGPVPALVGALFVFGPP